MSERAHRDVGSPVGVLITVVAMAASACVVLTLGGTIDAVRNEPLTVAAFFSLTLALQLFSVEVYGRGHLSVSAIGMLASGFVLGPGPAITISLLSAVAQWLRRRRHLHRGIFDAANFSLSAGAAAYLYSSVVGIADSTALRVTTAVLAGFLFNLLNTGLLCLAMSLSEQLSPRAVWRERFSWARFHYLAFGPLALACAFAYQEIGFVGLAAFTLPPALLMFTVSQYLERTRSAVEEVRSANENLRRANEQLAEANDDLRELFGFAGGLAARAHDRAALVGYAEQTLRQLTGARALISDGESGGIQLLAGGRQVGSLRLGADAGFDTARWDRLRDALLPQLATAIESAGLVERVKKTHLATIAALSRSMEAKDYYTGGHTERVSDVAVALADRLGYSGPDLEAIEIGALLHDIGKIGIPEAILQKAGPLDDDEWEVMRRHPVISEYILSEVGLPPIVTQIARWSHERIDGAGYPDGLAGAAIPLPARIVLVADAFDALTSDRSYRQGRAVGAAIEELRRHVGTQFCPTVIDALEQLYGEDAPVLAPKLLAVDAA